MLGVCVWPVLSGRVVCACRLSCCARVSLHVYDNTARGVEARRGCGGVLCVARAVRNEQQHIMCGDAGSGPPKASTARTVYRFICTAEVLCGGKKEGMLLGRAVAFGFFML